MNADQKAVAKACVLLFDRIQHLPKDQQLLALAGAFVLMSMALRFPAQDAFTAVKNLMRDPLTASGLGLQFDAMRWHLEDELAHDAPVTAHGSF